MHTASSRQDWALNPASDHKPACLFLPQVDCPAYVYLPSEGRGGLLLSSPQLLGFWIGSSVSQVDTRAAFEMDSHGFQPQLCTDSL